MKKTETDDVTGQVTSILTLNDICDCECNSAAYVRIIIKDAGYLDFCGHHYQKYKTIFDVVGFPVIDERHRLLDRSYSMDVWARGDSKCKK